MNTENNDKPGQKLPETETGETQSNPAGDPQEAVGAEASELKEELTAALNDLKAGGTGENQSAVEDVKAGVRAEIDEVKGEVLGEVQEAKDELISGLKETFQDFVDTVFGDFQAFLTLFKFTGMWFIKPMSYNVLEMRNRAKGSAENAQKFFTDVKLMKAMFIFSLLFIAVESTYEVDGEAIASDEEITSQIAFLVVYLFLIVVYLVFAWVWKWAISLKVDNSRIFIGYLVYEYATVYFIQFITVAILRLNFEESTLGAILTLGVPFAHMMYFFYRLIKKYEVVGAKKWVGLAAASIFVAFFILVTGVSNQVVVFEGI